MVLENRGRHDPCVLPRAVAIVEAMAALSIADAALIQLSRSSSARPYPFIGRAGTMTAGQPTRTKDDCPTTETQTDTSIGSKYIQE